jgi:hypothetical protein
MDHHKKRDAEALLSFKKYIKPDPSGRDPTGCVLPK